MPVHVKRNVEIAFRYARCKIRKFIERSYIEIPNEQQQQNACGIDRTEHPEHLHLGFPGPRGKLFRPRIERDLTCDDSVFKVVENRHSFLDEVVIH